MRTSHHEHTKFINADINSSINYVKLRNANIIQVTALKPPVNIVITFENRNMVAIEYNIINMYMNKFLNTMLSNPIITGIVYVISSMNYTAASNLSINYYLFNFDVVNMSITKPTTKYVIVLIMVYSRV